MVLEAPRWVPVVGVALAGPGGAHPALQETHPDPEGDEVRVQHWGSSSMSPLAEGEEGGTGTAPGTD